MIALSSVRALCNLTPTEDKYTAALIQMDGECPSVDAAKLLENLAAVCSLFNLQEWERWLAMFPDAYLAELLL